MEIKFKKLHQEAIMPVYSHEGDAGANVFCLEDKVLQPGERHIFSLGFSTEFDNGYVALVWDRGGMASLHGITCVAGVIDANYRGEWVVVLLNTSAEPYELKKGDKIAQVLFQPVATAIFKQTEDVSDTSRGDGKFGSTGR